MELSTTAKQIRPSWGRVALLPSPVDDYERPSGLIVPDHYEGSEHPKRGVVIAVDNAYRDVTDQQPLAPGDVVWYFGGWTVRDTVIVDPQNIIAVEADV